MDESVGRALKLLYRGLFNGRALELPAVRRVEWAALILKSRYVVKCYAVSLA